MTTATLARRLDRDGLPIRRVYIPARPVLSIEDQRAWARLSGGVALAFTTGVLVWNLVPFVGWSRAFVDAVMVMGLIALAFLLGRAASPSVTLGLQSARRVVQALAWWVGLRVPKRGVWLPPLPWWPTGTYAVIPYHGAISRDGVIVRRTRLARHVDWVLVYDHSHVVAVARVTGQSWGHPGILARHYGPRTGLSARAYRTYLDGHPHACALTTDLAYTLPQPITLAQIGITGPLGSHRYIGSVA